jgi:hypothetical protein
LRLGLRKWRKQEEVNNLQRKENKLYTN